MLFALSQLATAQGTDPVGLRQTYMPADFARFAPRTAFDMAEQVPGFSIDEGDDQRGFGQADTNLLINGRRISGKSNGPVDVLRRIPAADVVRLEVVDGASLDIGGLSGQVLNVITSTEGGLSGQFRYSPQGRTDGVPFRWGDMSISLSGGQDATEWTLDIRNTQQRAGPEGPEVVTDGNGDLLDLRYETELEQFDIPGLAGSLTHVRDNGSVFNVSGEVNWFIFGFDEVSERNPINDVANVRTLRETEDEFNIEIGGDYEFDLGAGRLKLIGLHRYEDSPTEARVSFDFADGRPLSGTLFKRRAEEAETVLRVEYTHEALGGDWQWSFEGTHNFLDIDASLQQRDATGTLIDVDLIGASSRVEEDRGEITASYSRQLTSALQLQTSLGAEYSEIRQTGDDERQRDFSRPKGFVSLNWRASDGLDVSLQLERRVGQLNFFEFIASVNVNQNQVNVSNEDLVPPQSWLLDLQLQRALGSFGSLTVSAFYEDISDIVDQIPIEGGGQAPGNIDSATRYGVSTDLTLILDGIGWRGARLDLNAEYVDSSVTDPLLGSNRQISDDDHFDYDVTFRVDIPDTQWAVGALALYRENTPSFRLDQETQFLRDGPFTRLFVEHKDVFGMTLRGSISNLNDQSEDLFRTVFNDRITGDVAFREARFREYGYLLRLDIEGSF